MGKVTQAMYIPSEVLEELSAVSGIFWSSWEHEAVICDAIRAYIKPQPAAQLQPAASSDTGYQWKQLFLPDGTRLRASYRGASYFADIEGSEIKYEGQGVSPSGFANLRGSGNRNAWKAVWLRFPGSPQWVLADACRVLQKAAAERLFAAGPQAASETAPIAHRAASAPTIGFDGPGSAHVGLPDYIQTAPRKRKTRRGKRRHKPKTQ